MIKLIVHLADLHIRTTQYHEIYESQFDKLYKDLHQLIGSNYNFNDVRIVIAGDIFHNKINITNEQILIASKLLRKLTDFGKVVIIPGNHDFLENNMERIDSITPVVELLDNEHIHYYKNSGVYEDENIKWVVYSLYQHNQRPDFKNTKDHLYVGLFHGPIQGLSTDTGFTFEESYDKLNFVGLDLLLCGDIHLRQQFVLPNGGKAVMIGSYIQQNFGEKIKHHGYGVYDIENDTYSFRDIENESPFMHFQINDISDIDDGKETLLNLG